LRIENDVSFYKKKFETQKKRNCSIGFVIGAFPYIIKKKIDDE